MTEFWSMGTRRRGTCTTSWMCPVLVLYMSPNSFHFFVLLFGFGGTGV
jgi:hypothetical protein